MRKGPWGVILNSIIFIQVSNVFGKDSRIVTGHLQKEFSPRPSELTSVPIKCSFEGQPADSLRLS